MNRRRLLLLALTLSLTVCAVAVRSTLHDRPGVTEADTERVRDGMTTGQVRALLGDDITLDEPTPLGARMTTWRGRGGFLTVTFGTSGKVVWREWSDEVVYVPLVDRPAKARP
jgi:hypothetical protein